MFIKIQDAEAKTPKVMGLIAGLILLFLGLHLTVQHFDQRMNNMASRITALEFKITSATEGR